MKMGPKELALRAQREGNYSEATAKPRKQASPDLAALAQRVAAIPATKTRKKKRSAKRPV